jgi:hypothetical protein
MNDQSRKNVSSRHSTEHGRAGIERSLNDGASWIEEYLSVFGVGTNARRAAQLSGGTKGLRYPRVANLDLAFPCKLIELL